MGGVYVYERLSIMIGELFKRTFTALILLGCFFGAYLHSGMLFGLLLLTVLIIIMGYEWPLLLNIESKWRFALLSLFYPILPMLMLIFMTALYRSQDMLFPLYPFIIAWIYDTMGYFVGISFGIHKILPSVSPRKSWEGLVGSLIGVFIGNLILLQRITVSPFFLIPRHFHYILAFSCLTTLVAFAGGMFISYLKRLQNLKDTGSLLPGHGGLLDRFDSILFIGVLVFSVLLAGNFLI